MLLVELGNHPGKFLARFYKTEMTERQKELVILTIRTLVARLSTREDPSITYVELARQIGTSHRKLGKPLIKMAEVIQQCPVEPKAPSLNALVVYSNSHLPNVEGLKNANPDLNICSDNISEVMNKMNERAKAYTKWDMIIESIESDFKR